MLNWRQIMERLHEMSEEELKKMIDEEWRLTRRKSILLRLHQRYTMVRAARERKELLDDR